MNSLHICKPYSFRIHFNIIVRSTPQSLSESIPLTFSTQMLTIIIIIIRYSCCQHSSKKLSGNEAGYSISYKVLWRIFRWSRKWNKVIKTRTLHENLVRLLFFFWENSVAWKLMVKKQSMKTWTEFVWLKTLTYCNRNERRKHEDCTINNPKDKNCSSQFTRTKNANSFWQNFLTGSHYLNTRVSKDARQA